jgi:hypothetical protein
MGRFHRAYGDDVFVSVETGHEKLAPVVEVDGALVALRKYVRRTDRPDDIDIPGLRVLDANRVTRADLAKADGAVGSGSRGEPLASGFAAQELAAVLEVVDQAPDFG